MSSTNATETASFDRTLGLRSLVLFGLAYLTPMIVLGIFGVIATASQGASASAYLIALIAMLFTAASYGRLSARFPVSGSAYTYVAEAIDGRVGFFVGWAVLLDYLFLPMVIWLIGASYLSVAVPGVPSFVWIIAFALVTSVLNIVGIKVADRVNFVLMAFQFLVIGCFVALSIGHVLSGGGTGTLVSAVPFTGPDAPIEAVIGAAAIAAYSFLGFDAVTTLTEETREPAKTMPRAILLIALIGGLIFIVVTYFTQLVHPGGEFADEASAASEIARIIGGDLFTSLFITGLIIAQFTSGLAAQASGSRLLYAMGRDGALPRRVFGVLHRTFKTPIWSICIVGVVGAIAMFMDVSTSTSFVNFGAFIAFAMVNVSVIVLAVRKRDQEPIHLLRDVIFPTIGALVIIGLLTQLDSHALVIGGIWVTIGLIVLGALTGGFRRQPPKVSSEEFGNAG